jgi:PBP1b-binding outer membrane lipoprotein LpoB
MKYLYLILVLFSVLLNGCVAQPKAQSQAKQKTELPFFKHQADISDILTFSHTFASLDVESQKKNFDEVNQQAIKDIHDMTLQIKLATMLALPTSHLRDSMKATGLMQTLMQNKTLSEPEIAYIETLYAFTTDIIKQQLLTKDESKKNDVSVQKYEALQKKYSALEQKLTDLKNIEKKLNDRDIKTNDKQ